jgi:hypothetical protein
VARTYAGILGPLAFVTALMRGITAGGGTDSVLWTAWCSLWAFAAIGFVIGWVAEQTVLEAVGGRIAAELAGKKPSEPAPTAGRTGGGS